MWNPTHPVRYRISKGLRLAGRSVLNVLREPGYAKTLVPQALPVRLHQVVTPLFRNLPGVDPVLFDNKRINFGIALEGLNGILVKPWETFSFWRLVGKPSPERGFRDGLVIQQGRAEKGVGGGLCQISNMVHFLALHSGLRVVERHRHSYDLFPDDDRKVPFGTGATVAYNFKDLRIHNPTGWTYQFRFNLEDGRLQGDLFCSQTPDITYQVLERESRFEKVGSTLWRHNRLVRSLWDVAGQSVGQEDLFENHCECRYHLSEAVS